MANKLQEEIDALREQHRLLKHEHEAAVKELEALQSGKHEARRIAETAEVAAAERDSWKAQCAELAAYSGDLVTLLHYYESNMSPPPDLLLRVNTKRQGPNKLQNGAPKAAVPA